MKLAVVGSRSFNNVRLMNKILSNISFNTFISGGANGADKLGENWARKNGVESIIIYKPNWDKYGKRAGFIRNKKIVNKCDKLIAFWDLKSHGTKHSIDLAKSQGKLLGIIPF